METMSFRDAKRKQSSLLAGAERHILNWLVRRIPNWIIPDHLTMAGFLAMLLAAVSYGLSGLNPAFLHMANLWLLLNWLGDSLDGTLARYRNRQRPRYGFYVDHLIDTFGAFFIAAGLMLSGYVSQNVILAALILYFMLSINVYLATYTLGTFELSFWKFSPTELRLGLAIGNVALLHRPQVQILGKCYLLFDVGGVIAIILMVLILLVSAVQNTQRLYHLERL